MIGMDTHHVRTVLGARSIWSRFKTREAEDEADDLVLRERADNQAAIVNSSDENVRGDDVGFTPRPDNPLQGFNGGHFFGGFK